MLLFPDALYFILLILAKKKKISHKQSFFFPHINRYFFFFMLGGCFDKPNEQVVTVNFDFGIHFWSFLHLEKQNNPPILRRKENT